MLRRLNQDFFKVWTPNMAYVLGFFAADGTMIVNKRGAYFIEFNITDKKLLMHIRDIVGSDHKIAVRNRNRKNSNWKIGYRLQIGSKQWFEDLTEFGFTPRKSLVMKMPAVPTTLFGDFLRGYFDGDGNVHFKKYWAKDRQKMRWPFSTRFTSGSTAFLKSLHAVLHSQGLEGGFITAKNRGHELVFSHRDSVALFHLMYDTVSHNGLYLARKYKPFRKAIETLWGRSSTG